MWSSDEFAELVRADDGSTFQWVLADSAPQIARLLEPDLEVLGFLVFPAEGERTKDLVRWTLWILTGSGLLRFFRDVEAETVEQSRMPSRGLAVVDVRQVAADRGIRDSAERYVVRRSVAEVRPIEGESLRLTGADWLRAWGNPSDLAVQGAHSFFTRVTQLGA